MQRGEKWYGSEFFARTPAASGPRGAEGERHIARVREIIAGFERDGNDASKARSLLETFISLQAEHVAHRDRLIEELEDADGQRSTHLH
jgi:hypothetical protein